MWEWEISSFVFPLFLYECKAFAALGFPFEDLPPEIISRCFPGCFSMLQDILLFGC